MKRVGIFGGTFNPIHNGHLALAQAAYEALRLDGVIFIPSNIPVNARKNNIIEGAVRYELVKRAVALYPHFKASAVEVRREGRSYSIDTVEQLRQKHPGIDRFYFLIGSDNIPGLKDWKRIEDLTKLVTFVCVNRPGCPLVKSKIDYRVVEMPDIDIASSTIRQRIKAGKEVRYMLPEKVYKYIEKHQIYR